MEKRGQFPLLFLVSGLFIATILLVMFGSGESVAKPKEILSLQLVGNVGEGKSNLRHIPIGDAYVGLRKEIGPIAKEEKKITILRGIVVNDEYELKIGDNYVDTLPDSKLSFNTVDTNGYGLLLLRLNGYMIWSGSPKINETVEIKLENFNKIVKATGNSIRFTSTSSGWRIWAPSFYVIDGIALDEDIQRSSEASLNFTLSKEEVAAWLLGRTAFTVTGGEPTSDMIVKVNNVTIWRGIPAVGFQTIADFSKVLTNIGEENVLSFELEKEGSYNIKSVEVIVFTNSEGKSIPSVSFDLSSKDLEALGQGKLYGEIEFEINDVITEGELIVILQGEKEHELLRKSLKKEDSPVILRFTEQDARAGTNTLTLKSSGIYSIRNLKISLIPGTR